MAHRGNLPKKGNPRYEELTGGQGTTYYLARRYFQLSPAEWDELPWWQSTCYLEGLEAEGVIGDKNNKTSHTPKAGQPGKPAVGSVDYAEDPFLPRGFTTRRAG